MILPDNKIKEWISEGKLLINEDGSTIFSPIVQNISYDLSTRKFYSKEQDSEGTDGFKLRPLDSVFVASTEHINLPSDVAAEVKLKYSLMTDGLMLDAPFYQPGHHGSNVFFRLTNISNKDIQLSNDRKYAYMVFHQVSANVDTPYNGEFCNSQKSINEIREHSYRGVYPDIMNNINSTRTKMNNAEKTIYGNVLVIITVFITLFSILSSFFNATRGNFIEQCSTTFLILGSIFALIGAVCVAIDNDKSFISKIIALWVVALIFFILSFTPWITGIKMNTTNQATSSSQGQDLYESPPITTERKNVG